jgi:hypothetical protein
MQAANNDCLKNRDFAARDRLRRLAILEPTGSINPRLLPLEETYGAHPSLLRKACAERFFMKNMKQRLEQRRKQNNGVSTMLRDQSGRQPKCQDDDEREEIGDMFVGEGLAHYVERQHENRRVSSFYNHVVMGVSANLKQRFDLSLSQFAYCNQKTRSNYTYGVTTGELIRNRQDSKLAFVCPFKESRQQWLEQVLPTVEAIQNEMPISAFGRYTDEEYEEKIFSRCVQLDKIDAQFDYARYRECDVSRKKHTEFDQRVATVCEKAEWAVVRLYSRCWKMTANTKKTRALMKFIESSPALVDYACFIEKHIPVCEPVLEMILIVDVEKCFALDKSQK